MPDFCYKIYDQGSDRILAISDTSIIGKTFNQDGIQITVSEEFYCGDRCNAKKAIEMIKKSTIVNAVGKDIIGIMIKENIVNKDSVLLINNIPHAQIVAVA